MRAFWFKDIHSYPIDERWSFVYTVIKLGYLRKHTNNSQHLFFNKNGSGAKASNGILAHKLTIISCAIASRFVGIDTEEILINIPRGILGQVDTRGITYSAT